MTNLEILKQWEITEKWLREARSALRSDVVTAKDQLENFEEYLADNELELALEELAEVAGHSRQGRRFWDLMIQAARSMKLEGRADAFIVQWAVVANVKKID